MHKLEDLRGRAVIETTATVDLTLLTPVLQKYEGRKRDALLPLLHEAQALYGWLPRQVQEAIAHTLRVPLADIHGASQCQSEIPHAPEYSGPGTRPREPA